MKNLLAHPGTLKVMLALCVLVLLLNNYELTFAIWFMTAMLSMKVRYSLHFLKLLMILTLVLIIATLSSYFNDHKSYNFFRDAAYLLKPILGILIGYNICKTLGRSTLLTVVYIGVALAAIHIAVLVICYTLFAIRDIHMLRHYGGYFNDFEIYVLVILIFHKKLGLKISRRQLSIFIILLSASSFLYLARINIIQLVILLMALKGFFRPTRRNITILLTTTFVILAAYGTIYYSNPNRKGKGLEAFLYKIKIAPIESFKTKINEDDWKDFNDNYRSFENIITARQVGRRDWSVVIFGEGLGSTVDIGREIWTNDGEFVQYQPILHNSYMTMFLKAGLAGVFLTIVFIFYIGKVRRSSSEEIRSYNDLLLGSALFLLLSNWVFMGLYLKLDNKSILLGFLICYREIRIREIRKSSTI